MRFELESHHSNIADNELLEDLRIVASKIDKSKVTIEEYNERGKFHATTLTRRFGSWFVALEKAGLERTRNLNISDEELFENIVHVWTKVANKRLIHITQGDPIKLCWPIFYIINRLTNTQRASKNLTRIHESITRIINRRY